MALTAGRVQAGTRVRVGGLGGRGIAAALTIADAMAMVVAMLLTTIVHAMMMMMVIVAMTAPMPVAPTTTAASLRRRRRLWKEFACARGRRARAARI
eukprot:44605-Pyramimonas_sp.AAC.1